MKTVLVFAAVLALAACAVVPGKMDTYKQVADKKFLTIQKDIFRLFHRIQQKNIFTDQVEIGDNYDIEANLKNYRHPQMVKQFLQLYKKGMLPRGETFSVYYLKQKEQAVMLFDLLYFANDYETFYKTACWARDRVNEGMFLYSLSIAVFHREDTKYVVLPPPYEVYPYLFVDDDVIQEGYKCWTKDILSGEKHTHIIPMNTTIYNQDQLLSYFTEDINLNTFNTFYRYYYPSWYNTTIYGHKFDRRGEQFYYTQHQIYVRYLLERLSNELPDIEPFVYDLPLKTSYNPKLRYHNGEQMPMRPSNLMPKNFDLFYVSDIKSYERRVEDAIDLGYLIDLAPSALEHPQTTLRDPVYYQIWKRLEHYITKYKNKLPSYTYDQLYFPGVKIENVEVDKLYTYFEKYEIPLDYAMYVNKVEDTNKVDIRASQYRLNHKPYTYKIDVTSDKDTDVYVRVFLGPKYDNLKQELDIEERRHLFVEMDRFPYHVKTGKNVIIRNSKDSSIISPDMDTYKNMYNKVKMALEGTTEYYINEAQTLCGYPENLLLPKGKKGGQAYTFYVIVTPYVKQGEHDFEPYNYKAFSTCGVGLDRKYPDDKPLGFPFDRQIYTTEFYTPNMYFKDVLIFHKKIDDINVITH